MTQLPDDKLRQFWQESTKPAPEGFSDYIMQHLPQQVPLPDALKKPLLSPWVLVTLAALLVVVGYFISSSGGSTAATGWSLALQQGLTNSLGWLESSPATLPTLAVLSVAVVILTFLDKLLQRFLQRTS